MLDSTVAVMKILFTLLVILIQETPVNISAPQAGETLRGQVEIIGNMDVPNFLSAELTFTYAVNVADTLRSNSGQAWFSIRTFPQPVVGTTIAIWDTTSLTDGDYSLRLRVFFQDGSFQDALISGLKIRNDAPLPAEIVPTETAFPQFISTLPTPALTGLPAIAAKTYPSPEPLPANLASVTISSIYFNFARGALITLVLFIVFSLVLRLRKS